jgi:hypothetical protein
MTFDTLWVLISLVELSDEACASRLKVGPERIARWKSGAEAMPPQYRFLLVWLAFFKHLAQKNFFSRPDAATQLYARATQAEVKVAPNWRTRIAGILAESRERIDAEFEKLRTQPADAQRKALDMATRWGWLRADKAHVIREALAEPRAC